MSEKVVGRFAPSPTGRMHAGNIYAALVAWLVAKSQGGEIVLRIEDLDRERSKSEYIDAVQQDFEMLGLTWDRGPFFQHDRDEAYAAAFDSLKERGLIYPCYCTRADLHAASAPHRGEKLVYPGTCRLLSAEERAAKEASGRRPAMRLRTPDEDISFHDSIQGDYSQNLERDCGDFLVRRSDQAFPYADLEARGLISPVLHVECDYGESVRYGDKVVVQLAVTALKPTKVQFRYKVFDGKALDFDAAKPFATGMSEHCLIRRDDFKPVSMKKAVPELYERYKAALEPDYQ